MNLNELRDRAYKIACDHGFHDKELSNEHWLCLVISELMEAVEADRKGKKPLMGEFECGISYPKNDFNQVYDYCIKGSVEEEISDAFIRLLDLAGARNLNLNRFCLKHVVTERKTFTENIYAIIKDITNYKYSQEEQVNYALSQISRLSEILKIDLEWHVNQKMKYTNSVRRCTGKSIESMKRVIKFRGKRTDTGEWVYGSLLMWENGDYEIITQKSPIDCDKIAVIPDTIGQFTGLLDKNGKEIYNGDILSSNGKIIGYVIDGVRGYCYDVVYTPPLANGETSWSLYGVVVNDHPNEIEVSGNVFDNP